MLCENPICIIEQNGERKFLSKEKRSNIKPYESETCVVDFYSQDKPLIKKVPVIKIPCGKCLMCRWERSNEWALRCKLEATKYENNQFITVTYGRQGSEWCGLTKKDFDRLIHNLREHFRRKCGVTGIRYFGCGEYGKEKLRPHYHFIFFNCPPFGDEKFYRKDKAGFPLYKSKLLEHLWGKGFCLIGGVSDKSIDYVVRTLVKSYFIKPPENYKPAFISMSRQGGIGKQYFIDHFEEIVNTDGIMYSGEKYSIPRAFDRLIQEKIGKEKYAEKITTPRRNRAQAQIEKIACESGITPNEAILLRRSEVEAYIQNLILHDEKTQI